MIHQFHGEFKFLSNFYHHPIVWENIRYPSTEHAYQAAKTMNVFIRQQMAHERSPGKVKRLGNKLTLRPDWEKVKLNTMLQLCQIKFAVDTDLARQLIATRPHVLVEGNKWGDTFWGVCDGVGENHLGKILMHIRDQIC